MRDFEKWSEERRARWQSRWERRADVHNQKNHMWTGLFLLVIGAAALAKSYLTTFPDWIFSWQMLLIVLGLFIGVSHRFRGGAWFGLLLVGSLFLVNDYFTNGELRRQIWPLILIILGIVLILRPRRRFSEKKNTPPDPDLAASTCINDTYGTSEEDYIDSTAFFGSAKKIILTKDFKGGDIVNVFGGTELNLSQADMKSKAVLEVTNIFGGAKLIIPANWSVKSEAVTIFGGIEDKRPLPAANEVSEKVLILKGTVIFGGIDIKSF